MMGSHIFVYMFLMGALVLAAAEDYVLLIDAGSTGSRACVFWPIPTLFRWSNPITLKHCPLLSIYPQITSKTL